MHLYKVKIKETVVGKPTPIVHTYGGNYCVKVQAVYYSSKDPSSYLILLDAGGDPFMFDVPGQANPKPTSPELPVTVRLPLSYVDTQGQNEVTIWGEVYPIDRKESSL